MRSSMRRDCCFSIRMKVARDAWPAGLFQPGSRSTTLACQVGLDREAVSPSPLAILPLNLIGTGPVSAPPISKPR